MPSSVAPTPPSGEDATDEVLILGENDRRRRKKRRRQVIAGVAVLAVAGGGVSAWLVTRTGGSASATTTGFTTTTELVAAKTGNMDTTASASGTLEPADEADLTFAVSGEVTSVKVTDGEKVKKGQVLATVGTTALSEAVSQADENLTSANAALTTATDDDDAASEIDQDQATVTNDQTDVTNAKADLADADLKSTITGEVSTVGLAVGDEVTGSGTGSSGSGSSDTGSSGTGSSGTGTSSTGSTTSDADAASSGSASDGIEVVSTGRFTVSADVDDTEVSSVKVGDPVVITPSESETTVDGKVTSVGLVASDSEDVSDFPVTISVTGVHDSLYAGATATVSITVKELKNVIEIPTAAISYTGSNPTVTVSIAGQQATKTITTGSTLDDETQVTSGLAAGDKVVEKVIKFKGANGSSKSLFGGTAGGERGDFAGGARRGDFTGGGGFGGGGGAGLGGGAAGGAAGGQNG
jgi:membrane fusion protein, macrolide-specific efflux system